MWLNRLCSIAVGYFVASGIVMVAAALLLLIMRRLRIRELDIAYIEQSCMAIKPHPLCGLDRGLQRPPYSYANGAVVDGVEDPDIDIREMVDPEILWQAGMLGDLEGHLVADYYDCEGEQTPDGVRRKTLAEPSLPILPEVPSQENSSVSRMDCSIHSGGRRESDVDTLMGSGDGSNNPNAAFTTIDEKATSTSGSLLSVDTIPGAIPTRATKLWMRKGSLPEKRSPTIKWATLNRRRSVDPEALKSMMYLPIPKTSFSHESVNVEINIVPPTDNKPDPIRDIFNVKDSDSGEDSPRQTIQQLFKQEDNTNTDCQGTVVALTEPKNKSTDTKQNGTISVLPTSQTYTITETTV